MHDLSLPERCRPINVPYKRCVPGVDLPGWFIGDLKSIDKNLHIVWHEWRLLWDDLINQYEGLIEDPRHAINYDHGSLNFGFVLTDGKKAPIPEQKFHVWALADYGWYHVIDIASQNEKHLKQIVKTLNREAVLKEKGRAAYMEAKRDAQEDAQKKRENEGVDKFQFIQNENKRLMQTARENFERGHVAPTNPMVEKIISYPGQVNRSKTVRPLDDKEAGLTTWEDV